MSDPTNTRIPWEVIGKVLTVLGVAVGIIFTSVQLYTLYRGEYQVRAFGDYGPFESPYQFDQLGESLKKIEGGLSNERLNQISPKLTVEEREKIISEYDKFIKENAPKKFWENLYGQPRSVWWFVVENNGRKEVTDIKLEVPFEGIARTERTGENSDLTHFKNTVTIGSLRPSHKLQITVWNTSFINSPRLETDDVSIESPYHVAEEVRLTHPNGVIEVMFPTKVRGFWAWVIWFIDMFWVMLVVLIVIFIASFFLTKRGLTAALSKDKSKTVVDDSNQSSASL